MNKPTHPNQAKTKRGVLHLKESLYGIQINNFLTTGNELYFITFWLQIKSLVISLSVM